MSPHSGVDPHIQNVSGSDPGHLGNEQPVLGEGRGGDLHRGVLACPAVNFLPAQHKTSTSTRIVVFSGSNQNVRVSINNMIINHYRIPEWLGIGLSGREFTSEVSEG